MPRPKPKSAQLSRKHTPPVGDDAIARAALTCAAATGWPDLTLAAVAKDIAIPLADLEQRVGTRNQLVPLIGRFLDAGLPTGGTGSIHDQLFDLLMARFDAMQAYRAAILSMDKAAHRDPGLTRALLCATRASMTRIADSVKADRLPPRPLLQAGITAIYLAAFIAWRRDESRDMARTMAALDRGLRWAGQLAERLPI